MRSYSILISKLDNVAIRFRILELIQQIVSYLFRIFNFGDKRK